MKIIFSAMVAVATLATPLALVASAPFAMSAKTNNQTALPDLTIESVSLGSGNRVIIVVKNVGTEAVPSDASFVIKGVVARAGRHHSSQKTFTFSSSALAPGETASFAVSTATNSSRPKPGIILNGDTEHDLPIERPDDPNDVISIKVQVDSGAQVDESDETNNTIARKFKVVR